MRKSILATASVAILGVVALSACDFSFGKKGGDAGTEAQGATGGTEGGGAATEGTSGKPADEASAGAEGGAGDAGGGEGGKPEDEGAGGGAPAGGEAPSGGGFGSGAGGAPAGGGGGGGGVRTVGDVPQEFAQLMVRYLDYYQQNFAPNFGSASVQDVATGLQAGNEYRWNVGTLRGGQTYTFLASCDNDCSDVDLIIEDGNGIEVGQDLLTDDYPVVTITPRVDGPFTARILLVNCTVEPCFVGGRVVQQGR